MIFDEVHRCKGNEVKKVAEQVFNRVPIRWGLTGTIPKQKIDYYNLVTAIGPLLDENVKFKTNTNYAETKDANNTQPAVCTTTAKTPEATPAFSTKTHDYFCTNGTLK